METYIKQIFNEYQSKNNWKGLIIKLRYDQQLKSELIQNTSFLPDSTSNSERVYYYKEGLKEIQFCPYCKTKPLKFHKLDKGFFGTCGDEQCKKEGMSKGAKTERDWNAIQSKMRATYKAKTGYEHNMQNPEFKKKYFDEYAKTHEETFSVRSEKSNKNRERTIQEKYNGNVGKMLLEGTIKKYGSVSAKMKHFSKMIGEKEKETALNQLKEKMQSFNFELLEMDGDKLEIKCLDCGTIFHLSRQSTNIYIRNGIRFCPKCNYKNMTFRSGIEREVGDTIKSFYTGEIQYNKYIAKVECDIILPDINLGIEVNGCYWHSEEYKDRNYHIEKKKKIESVGYNLIQIWEDDWNSPIKRDIIISRLRNKIGCSERIFARKCQIKKVEGVDAKKFLNENHLQGYIPSTYNLGLYYKNELVEIITIGKGRKLITKKDEAYELYRLCTKKGVVVVGGFSKLINQIKIDFQGCELISYSDCDWCKLTDNGYTSVGFVFDHLTVPDYHWLVNNVRQNRLNFTKQKLVERGEDVNLSELKIMHNKGYKRVFGSGNIMFRMVL